MSKSKAPITASFAAGFLFGAIVIWLAIAPAHERMFPINVQVQQLGSEESIVLTTVLGNGTVGGHCINNENEEVIARVRVRYINNDIDNDSGVSPKVSFNNEGNPGVEFRVYPDHSAFKTGEDRFLCIMTVKSP